MEIAIPWSNLGVTPGAGTKIGFDLGNNDDDNGGSRDNQLMWHGNNNNWQNTSAFGELELFHDTQAPTAPANLRAAAVAATSLTLNWEASTDNEGVAGYRVYAGSELLKTVQATTAEISALSAGTSYAFRVIAFDDDGNESGAAELNVTTNALPRVTITGPAAGSTFTLCAPPVLQVSASDDDGSIVAVVFFANGQPIGVGDAENGWSLTWTDAAPGQYVLSAVVKDDVGDSGESAEVAFTVVADQVQPEMAVKPEPATIRADAKDYTFALADLIASITDNCDGDIPVAAAVITRVTSDELNPDIPNRPGDIRIAADCRSVVLRADRDQGGNGRVYTIHFRVADARGNVGEGSYQVMISNGKGTAVADSPRSTVTGSCGNGAARVATDAGVEDAPVRIFPNPARGHFFVAYTAPADGQVQISVKDLLARTVQAQTAPVQAGPNRIRVDAAGLKKGTYLVRIASPAGMVVRKVQVHP